MKEKTGLRLNTVQKIALGFLGVILFGSLLLWLPQSNQQPITYIDALFTSASAVCVTGLVTVVPAAQFTLFGKVILLLLVQVGGLGIIACMMLFLVMIKRKITVKERVMIRETYGLDTLSGMVRLILWIVKATLLIEAVGAILYAFQFIPQFGLATGIGYSVFHSVSAFCNAGIDILGTDSFYQYVSNPLINFTTMFLVVMGGLGFLVWDDVIRNTASVISEKAPVSRLVTRLQLHTKIVLVMTLGLILAGTLSFLLIEYNNPHTLAGLTPGGKVMAALFQSITSRTAGYSTVSQAVLKEESLLIGSILMFIGGSPMGTAGGVKTTTIAMLVLTCLAVARGGHDTECFGRKIAADNIRTGFCVVAVFFAMLLGGTILVSLFESETSLMRIMYETTSAIATVGLSTDLTPHLQDISKGVIIVLMYLGRIGPLTMALVMGSRMRNQDYHRELPIRRIIVG